MQIAVRDRPLAPEKMNWSLILKFREFQTRVHKTKNIVELASVYGIELAPPMSNIAFAFALTDITTTEILILDVVLLSDITTQFRAHLWQ